MVRKLVPEQMNSFLLDTIHFLHPNSAGLFGQPGAAPTKKHRGRHAKKNAVQPKLIVSSQVVFPLTSSTSDQGGGQRQQRQKNAFPQGLSLIRLGRHR
jgi:hypothetical protein